eukprot:89616-Pelagomonas_calceolata.AAC.2
MNDFVLKIKCPALRVGCLTGTVKSSPIYAGKALMILQYHNVHSCLLCYFSIQRYPLPPKTFLVLNQLPIDEAEIEGGGFLHGSEQLSIEIARPPIETFSFDIVVAQLRPQEGLRWAGASNVVFAGRVPARAHFKHHATACCPGELFLFSQFLYIYTLKLRRKSLRVGVSSTNLSPSIRKCLLLCHALCFQVPPCCALCAQGMCLPLMFMPPQFLALESTAAVPEHVGRLARAHKGVTLMFMDICGFTAMCKVSDEDLEQPLLQKICSWSFESYTSVSCLASLLWHAVCFQSTSRCPKMGAIKQSMERTAYISPFKSELAYFG